MCVCVQFWGGAGQQGGVSSQVRLGMSMRRVTRILQNKGLDRLRVCFCLARAGLSGLEEEEEEDDREAGAAAGKAGARAETYDEGTGYEVRGAAELHAWWHVSYWVFDGASQDSAAQHSTPHLSLASSQP